MDETIIFPSPNWFQVSGLVVSKDNWLVYGGPSKSLCVLVPISSADHGVIKGKSRYEAHWLSRAHTERITCLDLHPEWPEKRCLLSGSADGTVKQWNLEHENGTLLIKCALSHNSHTFDHEEVVGAGYSNEVYSVSIGSFGNIVKWNLNSNVVKVYKYLLKNFKPSCLSCSPHKELQVAVGTKQAVVFVLDLNGDGKIMYKVRGQDDEIMNLSWCPVYDVTVKKCMKEIDTSSEKIDKTDKTKETTSSTTVALEKSGVFKNLPDDSFGEMLDSKNVVIKSEHSVPNVVNTLYDPENTVANDDNAVPDNESVVPEDDIFDIYKDHESDEFGHKKYEPEDIVVKVKNENKKELSYLEECKMLKEDILKSKNAPEPSIESLVKALDNVRVEENGNEKIDNCGKQKNAKKESSIESHHPHKHLLASISRHGSVRIWSKSGKLVGSCSVSSGNMKHQRMKAPTWSTLLWYQPDLLLIADGKSQLLRCNPLKLDSKNKLEWRPIHNIHKRGLYCIAGKGRRGATEPPELHVWTASQDRTLVQYSLADDLPVAVHVTAGGFVYNVQSCPYDAGRFAIGVGDGAVRVWSTHPLEGDENKLAEGSVRTYWQSVGGKVLTVAWHPTRENLIAFGTAEARVGVIDTSQSGPSSTRVLPSALGGGVYSLCWGDGRDLFACAGHELLRFDTADTTKDPSPVRVSVEGRSWEVSVVRRERGLLACGGAAGGVCLLDSNLEPVAATFVFSKMIYGVEWHPIQTSGADEESPCKNLIAVCSLDKLNTIVILEYVENEDGSKQLRTVRSLAGHTGNVLEVAWNPHRDGVLLSCSQDCTARVWNVREGVCVSVFSGHTLGVLTGAWSAFPQLAGKVVTGGADCCLRLWDAADHPAAAYSEAAHETRKNKKKKKSENKKKAEEVTPAEYSPTVEQLAATAENKLKGSKKFLFPLTFKQIVTSSIEGPRKMLQKYLEKQSGESTNKTESEKNEESSNQRSEETEENDLETKNYDLDYLKMFGSINEVNELLDEEMERHLCNKQEERWVMCGVLRGRIDHVVQFAAQRDMLCPFLLSIAPCVSYKYWKDATKLYLAQIDRLVAKGEDDKLYVSRAYGGAVYRKVATLLSLHDVKGAVDTLVEARLFKEAYLLCRIRYLDSIAEQTLQLWAQDQIVNGQFIIAAVCYIVLGNLSQAATVLARCKEQTALALAAEIAKIDGQVTFADHIEQKKACMIANETTYEALHTLPTRMELLLREREEVHTDSQSQLSDAKEMNECSDNV